MRWQKKRGGVTAKVAVAEKYVEHTDTFICIGKKLSASIFS